MHSELIFKPSKWFLVPTAYVSCLLDDTECARLTTLSIFKLYIRTSKKQLFELLKDITNICVHELYI